MSIRVTSNLAEPHRLTVHRMDHAHVDAPHPPTVHPHASLAYCTSGRAEMWCGATYTLGPGDVLLIPEGMPHYATSMQGVRGAGISACTSCLASMAGGHLAALFESVAEGAPASRTLAPEDRECFHGLLLQLERELDTPSMWQDLAIEGYVAVLTSIVLRAEAPIDVPKGASVSARALAFITRRATDGISLTDVAKHVHRSVAHTGAVVKAETGRTVVEWITHARLAAGRQLLLRSDASIEAVGARIGFESASHFHRVFKREHGVTPAEWRRRHHR